MFELPRLCAGRGTVALTRRPSRPQRGWGLYAGSVGRRIPQPRFDSARRPLSRAVWRNPWGFGGLRGHDTQHSRNAAPCNSTRGMVEVAQAPSRVVSVRDCRCGLDTCRVVGSVRRCGRGLRAPGALVPVCPGTAGQETLACVRCGSRLIGFRLPRAIDIRRRVNAENQARHPGVH